MSYKVYQADLKRDKETILNFWITNHKKPLNKKFKWIYEENPDGKTMVWLIKHRESGKYVGMTSVFPRKFFINNKWITGGTVGDFLINIKHRTLGPAIMLQKEVISAINNDSNIDFIYGFPNRPAEPVFKRVGWKYLGSTMRLVKILKTESQLKKKGINGLFVFFVAPIINVVIKLLSFETWHPNNYHFLCREIKEIDQRFDRLWEKNLDNFAVIGNRTSSFLKWKHINDPDNENKVFAIFDREKSSLKGFIVYYQKDKTVKVRDFLFSKDKEARKELLSGFVKYARKLKAESLIMVLLENKVMVNLFKKYGFLERKDKENVYLYCSDKLSKEKELLKSPNNWMLMGTDGDT